MGDGVPGGSSFPRTRARTHGVSRLSLTAGRRTTNPHDEAAASPPETGDGAGTLFSVAERVSAVEFLMGAQLAPGARRL